MPAPNSQFVIWGFAPGADAESLLVSEHAGLRDRAHADQIAAHLETECACTKTRVQKLEPLGDPSEIAGMFRRAVN
jgi:hypothetical protein